MEAGKTSHRRPEARRETKPIPHSAPANSAPVRPCPMIKEGPTQICRLAKPGASQSQPILPTPPTPAHGPAHGKAPTSRGWAPPLRQADPVGPPPTPAIAHGRFPDPKKPVPDPGNRSMPPTNAQPPQFPGETGTATVKPVDSQARRSRSRVDSLSGRDQTRHAAAPAILPWAHGQILRERTGRVATNRKASIRRDRELAGHPCTIEPTTKPQRRPPTGSSHFPGKACLRPTDTGAADPETARAHTLRTAPPYPLHRPHPQNIQPAPPPLPPQLTQQTQPSPNKPPPQHHLPVPTAGTSHTPESSAMMAIMRDRAL